MPWAIPLAVAAVGAGTALYTSSKQSKAINSAASAQQTADQAAIAEQQRQFDTNQANLKPFLTAGQSALQAQMALLGLGGASPTSPLTATSAAGAAPAVGGMTDAQAQQLLQDRPDVLAEFQRASAAGDQNSPAFAQAGLTSPLDYARHWYNNMGGSSSYTLPADQTSAASSAPSATGDAATQQQSAIDALKASPLYQSLYRNGQNTILANGSATGGLRGGNIQNSLANFGSDTLATVIQQQLQNLSGISSLGQSTGTSLGQLGNTTSTNISNLTTAGGASQAGGILGSAQANLTGTNSAIQQLLAGAGNSYAQYRASGGINSNQPVLI